MKPVADMDRILVHPNNPVRLLRKYLLFLNLYIVLELCPGSENNFIVVHREVNLWDPQMTHYAFYWLVFRDVRFISFRLVMIPTVTIEGDFNSAK